MPYSIKGALLVSLACVSSHASARTLATGDTFSLFAYGNGIGGFPILYLDGNAFIGDVRRTTNDSFALPFFTVESDSTWAANPNTTLTNSTATFSDATFFVPGPASTSHQVGFLSDNSTATDVVTTGFNFYGHTVIVSDTTGGFYALPSSDDGVWSLNWNNTGVTGAIPVTLRDAAPPNMPPPAFNGTG